MADKSVFTARETEVLALAWLCFESEPKIDMGKLASLTGYTTGSASVTLGKIKRKIKTLDTTQDSQTPKKTPSRSQSKTPNKAAKRSNGQEQTPSKRQKKATGQPSPNRQNSTSDDDDPQLMDNFLIKKEEFAGQSEGDEYGFLNTDDYE